jgi:hypothetical protein
LNTHTLHAFRLAHHAAENPRYNLAARNAFRAIAHELWQAAGRPDDEPADEPCAADDMHASDCARWVDERCDCRLGQWLARGE